ncbi:pyridoxamine 5'-phosphate oxidase family protein [Geobacter sp. SVR]|uniref:pyridoxamine 5'-phosphate oxidase family protein n=1 Tax=Geobacter sp. SVR TaxID=2495594 RepID=UPI00143EF8D6|nr:pyridoxamine 5'-phosphate oxidase family protein [Geobacter sp. SVR]BCS52558.1 hypothetical protein GSVR_08660 [Geobacter sp. SVR]GCF84004.1 hypothetical protein GSbR_06040 [Geobacter sp. SVR]
MVTEETRAFLDGIQTAIVATSDAEGHPHLALGSGFRFMDESHIVFQNWFCRTTLQNLESNPRVALAVLREPGGTGYQFIGSVVRSSDAALLGGYAPDVEPPDEPQALIRLVVRVERVLAFCSGFHTDLPVEFDSAVHL